MSSYFTKEDTKGFYYDTLIETNSYNYNPLTKKYDLRTVTTIRKMNVGNKTKYYKFAIYRNDYFLSFGMFCNGILNDTFYNRVFLDSFNKIINFESNIVLFTEIISQETKYLSALSNSELSTPSLKLFPNPATEYFEMRRDGTAIIPQLYDLRGKEIPLAQNDRNQFMIGHLPPGIYIVSVHINGVNNIQKLVVE